MLRRLTRSLDRIRQRAAPRTLSEEAAAGMKGEDIAQRYLEDRGYAILARNYRPRRGRGEIDLVVSKDGALVFVEVKTRRSGEFGDPVRAIDREKRRSLVSAAAIFARRQRAPAAAVRFDIVSVVLDEPFEVRHIENAFPFPLRW